MNFRWFYRNLSFCENRIFTKEEVREHSKEEDLWVTYKKGVYDVTKFLEQHPGGKEKLLLAAGRSMDAFWKIYPQHENKKIYEILEEYRIGDLNEFIEVEEKREIFEDCVLPIRNELLEVLTTTPFNAESPANFLGESFTTPNDIFFKRNHFLIPKVDKAYVEFLCETSHKISLENIKKFEKHELFVALQCSGNRRSGFKKKKIEDSFYEVRGLPWTNKAISNALFGGARFCEVLKTVFSEKELLENNHVIVQGFDYDRLTKDHYETSIPLKHALDPEKDVLLAYEMNKLPLPQDHGFPLRLVVPGVSGCRSVKWIKKITLSKEPSQSFWTKFDYKILKEANPKEEDYSKASPIMETPIQSSILSPIDGSLVDELIVKGYAFSGGGRPIKKVEVSLDQGLTWKLCDLTQENKEKTYAWTLFELHLDLPESKEKREIEIWCRAEDSSCQQPEMSDDIWNIRGLLNNSYHKIKCQIECKSKEEELEDLTPPED